MSERRLSEELERLGNEVGNKFLGFPRGVVLLQTFSKSLELPDYTKFLVQTHTGAHVFLTIRALRIILAGGAPWIDSVRGKAGKEEAALALINWTIAKPDEVKEEEERRELADIIARLSEEASRGNIRSKTYTIDGDVTRVEIYFYEVETGRLINGGKPFFIHKKRIHEAAKNQDEAQKIVKDIKDLLGDQSEMLPKEGAPIQTTGTHSIHLFGVNRRECYLITSEVKDIPHLYVASVIYWKESEREVAVAHETFPSAKSLDEALSQAKNWIRNNLFESWEEVP